MTGVNRQELPDAQWGEAKAFREQQQGAPLGAPPAPTGAVSGAPGASAAPLVAASAASARIPLTEPSQRADEPVTFGAELGPGPGPEVMGLDAVSLKREDVERHRSYLPVYMFQASQPDATPAFRNWVRSIRAVIQGGVNP